MMSLGKEIRINRIFSHPSGRLCSVAVDHFINYQSGLPAGLTHLPSIVEKIVEGRPDALTMMKGAAKLMWSPFAGRVPLIVSSIQFRTDESFIEVAASPEEVLALGGDAIAVAIGVKGPKEGQFLRILNEMVEKADRIHLPVIAHIYPRDFSGDTVRVIHDPASIMWAVRCGIEAGADVLKVPFTGDAASFRDIVASSPVPVVAAGGPRTETLEDALRMMVKVVESGACGATIGRNIWGWGPSQVIQNLTALKAVIHDGKTPEEALALVNLMPVSA